MTVICDSCQAANRDKAMFCSGCARKLQAFLANGPSMLSRLDLSAWRHPPGEGVSQAARSSRSVESLARRTICHSWLAGAMLLATGLVAALVWNGLSSASSDRPDAHATGMTQVDVTRSTIDEAMPTRESTPPQPGPAPSSFMPPAPAEMALTAPRQRPRSVARSRPAPSIRPSPGMGAGTDSSSNDRRDPRTGCEHLFFAFAARCTATRCHEAPYVGHPHCDQVRAEARREAARQDMTLN
jgi:hypothetical protein